MNISLNDYLSGGLGPIPDGSPNSGGLIAFPVEFFQTPRLDFARAVSNIELIPARVGCIPNLVAGILLIESVNGTQTSPCTMRAGSNAARNNFYASTATEPTNTNVNTANVPSFSNGPTFAGNSLQRFVNTPVYFDITSPAAGTGNFSVFGRVLAGICWATIG